MLSLNLTLSEELQQLMASREGRVSYLQGYGTWQATHAVVGGPILLHILAALLNLEH